MRRLGGTLVCAVLVAGAQPAFAWGGWTDHAIVSVNVGTQRDTRLLSESISLEKYVEQAPVTADISNKSITFFDFGATARVAGNLGAAVILSCLSSTETTDVTGQIPHPFYFKQPRPINGQVQSVQHSGRSSVRKAGYNAGAAVTWKLASSWGVGGVVRFSRAKVPFAAGALDFGTREVGGLQVGGGIRVMF